MVPTRKQLESLTLDEATLAPMASEERFERAIAVTDLLKENRFAPVGREGGPYALHLAIHENRLVFRTSDENGEPLADLLLSLSPFRRIIKDYFTVCESYERAPPTAQPSQIAAIDMGRRALHDEGSEILIERLAGRIEIDAATARRLFTLLCVLHTRV